MADFEDAIGVILAHEGGWCSVAADPGGETNYGISTLIIEREGITNEQLGLPPGRDPGWMKAMSVDAAKMIYQNLFWNKWEYGAISDQTAATKLFDCSVNCGPNRAHLMAQKAANACGQNIAEDGILGPATVAAINACDPKAWVTAFAQEMTDYYTNLVKARPSLGIFLKNWLHRASWGV